MQPVEDIHKHHLQNSECEIFKSHVKITGLQEDWMQNLNFIKGPAYGSNAKAASMIRSLWASYKKYTIKFSLRISYHSFYQLKDKQNEITVK